MLSDRFPAPPTSAHAVLIQGHPREGSFCHALGDAWAEGARAEGVHVDVLDLCTLEFSPLLDTTKAHPLEPDLEGAQALLARAAHIAVAYPVWWGSTPALLKGFFDRTLQSDWAYAYDESGRPHPGLAGRTGRVLVTMGAPSWFDRLWYGRSATRQVTDATFWFCGLRPTRTTAFHSLDTSTAEQRARMLARARSAGQEDGLRVARRYFSARPQPARQAS